MLIVRCGLQECTFVARCGVSQRRNGVSVVVGGESWDERYPGKRVSRWLARGRAFSVDGNSR